MGNMVANKEDVRKGCKWGIERQKRGRRKVDEVGLLFHILKLPAEKGKQ